MGHVRLGILPRSRKWRQVVEELRLGSEINVVAASAADAAEAALHGASSDPERGDLYDEELAIAVQNFQREHRLNVDGIAGLQTQVVLDTALAEPGSPLLLQTLPHS